MIENPEGKKCQLEDTDVILKVAECGGGGGLGLVNAVLKLHVLQRAFLSLPAEQLLVCQEGPCSFDLVR